MATREKFSCDVKPLIPIPAEAQKITGISLNGTEMTVKIYMYVNAFGKFLDFFKKFDSVILIAHNGRVFDFRVLSFAISLV